MRSAFQQLLSAVSLTAITLNLALWMIPLFAVSLIRAGVPLQPVGRVCLACTEFIYRRAVGFNSWWITSVLAVRLDIVGELREHRDHNLIVVCNHRSWFDILVLHAATIKHSPIVKFLIKRQLIHVPILGWICLALDFPRLNRGRTPEDRDRDYQPIANATEGLSEQATALLTFAEGTRFTRAKHAVQNSPYRHMLKPRAGGLRIMLENTDDTDILDLTIAYPREHVNFWRCLGGEMPYAKVYLHYFNSRDIQDAAAWLAERWAVKDQLVEGEFSQDR